MDANGEKQLWKWLAGALLAILLAITGILFASGQDAINANTQAIELVREQVDDHESRVSRCEAYYENILDLLWDLKGDLKEMRKDGS